MTTRCSAGILATVAALALGACGASVRRYPLASVVWQDDDQRTFSPAPAPFYSPYMWDGADNAFFRPASEIWRFEPRREAINVNAVDEVPDSSWFVNRIGRSPMSPEEVAAGACGERFEMPGPWTIVGGKPDGANPGFTIRDANGVRYLMKTEGALQPWRPGAADTIAAAIWHAAGYWSPCNQVVHFDPETLVRDPEATVEHSNGLEEPLTDADVERVLEAALRLPDGRYRASVSRFIEGRPISPWTYDGVRADDPNDVVPHEHRRELRGMYLLAAWTDHVDSRQENTMAAWMTEADAGEGYVRHYMIDFGDCFGVIHDWDALVRRLGHSGYLDFEHILVDFLTLDTIPRPWFEASYGPAGRTLGYFDARRFVPDRWRPGYPNPAFDRRTERDAAWMARIIARFGDEHVRALARLGRFEDPVVESELARILIGRRDRILERYLTRLSPLTDPRVRAHEDGAELCLEDVALTSGIRERSGRRYGARAWAGEQLVEMERPRLRLDEGRVCVRVPLVEGATRERPTYVIVDVIAQTIGRETTAPARVHLYAVAPDELAVVGLERPAVAEEPRP